MASSIGKNYTVSLFGQSHSAAIGCVVEGIPAGKKIDLDQLGAFLSRRAPGGMPWSTPRKEADLPNFLGGIVDGITCGAPLAATIENTNTKSSDYDELRRIPRPGHADYVANVKFGGAQDVAGGGHFSGRLTAPLCIAGGIAIQLLREQGIEVGAHIARIARVNDTPFPLNDISKELLECARSKQFPTIDDDAAKRMIAEIADAREAGDSVGGIVECAAIGLPVGIGEPMFDGIENAVARILFGIPAVKGVEFGKGFAVADMRGSQNNDEMRIDNGAVRFETNNAGGANGGISTSAPLVVRCAFKPTPSIAMPQKSIDMIDGCNADLSIKGRHDPCVVVRAVPVVEAAVAIALYDLWLESRMDR